MSESMSEAMSEAMPESMSEAMPEVRKKQLCLAGELVWYRFGPAGRAYRLRNVSVKVTEERRLTALELAAAASAEEARRLEAAAAASAAAAAAAAAAEAAEAEAARRVAAAGGTPPKKKKRKKVVYYFSKYRNKPTRRMLRAAAKRQKTTEEMTREWNLTCGSILVVFGSLGRFSAGDVVEPYGKVDIVADLVKYHARKEKHTCAGKMSCGMGLDGYEEVVLTCSVSKTALAGETQIVRVF